MKNSGKIQKHVCLWSGVFFLLAGCYGCAVMAASIATDAVQSATHDVMAAAAENGRNNSPQFKENVDALMSHTPVAATYGDDFDRVWDAVTVSLGENQEVLVQADMKKGNIRSGEKEWNPQMASALEMELGLKTASDTNALTRMERSFQGYMKHNFARYRYNIQVSRTEKGVLVNVEVVLSGDVNTGAGDTLSVSECCALLRARFFKTLNQKINPVYIRLPANPLRDVPCDNGNSDEKNRLLPGATPIMH